MEEGFKKSIIIKSLVIIGFFNVALFCISFICAPYAKISSFVLSFFLNLAYVTTLIIFLSSNFKKLKTESALVFSLLLVIIIFAGIAISSLILAHMISATV